MTAPLNSSRRRALLVEDSVMNQKVLVALLEKEGFNVLITVNGQEAFDAFQEQAFDVVIMDIQMPVMDGLEATRLIRKYEAKSGRHTPIVAVTAGFDRASCIAAGMDDYLCKPVLRPAFHEVLNRLCPVNG